MKFKRICVVGPGAIGGMMAVKLDQAGFEVSALVRPHRVTSMNAQGITLLDEGQMFHAAPRAAADETALGLQDLIVVTVKETALKEVAPKIEALRAPDTPVVQITNGIPWWFFADFGGPLKGTCLESVDKDRCVSGHFSLSHHIGGVINCGVSVRDDDVLVHDHSNQLQLGRPNNDSSGVQEIADVFQASGYQTEVAENIHEKVMTKLLANISFNPVSALTMATLDLLVEDPLVTDTLKGLSEEGRSVTRALGLKPGSNPADRITAGKHVPPSRTSMLQDMEQGKPLELDGIMASVIEVADLLDVPVPLTKTIYGLIRVRNRVAQGKTGA